MIADVSHQGVLRIRFFYCYSACRIEKSAVTFAVTAFSDYFCSIK